MLFALALYASTAHAGIPAYSVERPAFNETPPHDALELLGSEGSHGPRREPPLDETAVEPAAAWNGPSPWPGHMPIEHWHGPRPASLRRPCLRSSSRSRSGGRG